MIKTRYHKLVVYDPSDLDQRVQIEYFRPPHTIERRDTYETTGTGSKVQVRREETLEVSSLDFGDMWQLRSWADSETPVQAVLAGTRGVQWWEDTLLSVAPDRRLTGDLSSDMVRLSFRQRDANVHHNANVMLRNAWEDADGDDVADGFSLSGERSSDWRKNWYSNNPEQLISGAAGISFDETVEFPVEGEPVSAAVDLLDPHQHGDVTLTLKAQDKSGNDLDLVTDTLASWSDQLRDSNDQGLHDSTGSPLIARDQKYTISMTTPTGTRRMQWILEVTNVTGWAQVMLMFPAIRSLADQQPIAA